MDTTTIEFHMALGAIPIITSAMTADHGFGSDLAYCALTADPPGVGIEEFIAAAKWYAEKAIEHGDEASAKKFRACVHIGEYVKEHR